MKLLNDLQKLADVEQLQLHPLPVHAIAEQEEHLRQHYALMIAAVLASQQSISETQTRLFILLLNSMKLGDIRASLFEQAKGLTQDNLVETLRLIREQNLAENLLLDCLILLRLDQPIIEDGIRLIGELARFLDLDEACVESRADNAAAILGIEIENSVLLEHWPARIPNTLTEKALKNNIQGGLWYVEQDLSVNFPFVVEDAVFVFDGDVKLKVDLHNLGNDSDENNQQVKYEEDVVFKNCQFQSAQVDFAGKGKVRVENCIWTGEYSGGEIAVKATDTNLLVENSRFSTVNATAITIKGGVLTSINCVFERCGSDSCHAGGIHRIGGPNSVQSISGNKFTNCTGEKAGAIWIGYLSGLVECEFNNNISRPYTFRKSSTISFVAIGNTNASTSAAYLAVLTASAAVKSPSVERCIFRDNSLSIGSAYEGSNMKFVQSSLFRNSDLFYYEKYSSNTVASDCTFENGSTRDFKFD